MNDRRSRLRQLGARLPRAPLWAVCLALALIAVGALAGATDAQAPGFQQISAGGYHTCALEQYFLGEGASVQCWGRNDFGQAAGRAGHYIGVSAGDTHTCALRASGSVECWGSNERSACPDTWCPVYIGQASPPGGTFTQVSAGAYHTCGLRQDGSVDCWGDNTYGAAADRPGPYAAVSAGDEHTCALTPDGRVDCWGENTKGRAEGRPGPFTQLSAGGSHNCAVRQSDGAVECWGGDAYGQSTPPPGSFVEVSAGNLHTCGIKSSDHWLTCWGYNFYGQVKRAPAGWFKQVESGMGHSCGVTGTNEAYCWGRNEYGQANVPSLGGPGLAFEFDGFYPPIAPAPELNTVKAGSAVPLKFSLAGDHGLDVIDGGAPTSQSMDCALLDPGGPAVSTKPAGGSGLSYDAASDQYAFIWKTEKAWSGSCRVLSLKLIDGAEHLAAFRFK